MGCRTREELNERLRKEFLAQSGTEDVVPEQCTCCPKTIEAQANCGHSQCPFALSPMQRRDAERKIVETALAEGQQWWS